MNRGRRWRILTAFACVVSACTFAYADPSYPNRPVHLLVGFNAGGPTDAVARIVAEKLGERFKQPFVVDNRPGANGSIAAQAVIAGAPDGYMLLVGTSGALTIGPLITKDLPYQPMTDLAPIGMLASYPYALVVPTDLPVGDAKSLITYVKAHPGTVSYSSSGIGSVNHLGSEWFKTLAGIDITHVPYKGDAPALADLITGRVQMGFNTLSTALPQVKAGKLKALAVTSDKPTTLAPGLPTLTELGYKDFVVEPWNGLFGPAALAKDVIEKLNKALVDILSDPATQARIVATGQNVLIDTPEGTRKRVQTQSARWRDIAQRAGIQPQ